MSADEREITPGISNFTSIFEVASNKYKMLTMNDLQTHPYAAKFDTCDSLQAVLDMFQKQAQAFEEYRNGDDRLIKWLNPTINILFTLSATLGEGLALLVRLEEYPYSVSVLPDAYFLAVLPCKSDICGHWSPPHCKCPPRFFGVGMGNIQCS
jgi:hypothetical protein